MFACGCSIQEILEPYPEAPPYSEIVREIKIEGNGYTRDWIILDAMASKVGEPYTERSARTDFLWLSQLGAFTSVNFETEPAVDGITLGRPGIGVRPFRRVDQLRCQVLGSLVAGKELVGRLPTRVLSP